MKMMTKNNLINIKISRIKLKKSNNFLHFCLDAYSDGTDSPHSDFLIV